MTERMGGALPRFILRPLLGGAFGIIAFVVVFGLWTIFAPLATTITLQGTITSTQPSLALQHPYGGLVSEVFVDAHDSVANGQPLLRFDTALEQDTLAARTSLRDRLIEENALISRLLGLQDNAGVHTTAAAASPLDVRRRQVNAQRHSMHEAIGLLEQQIAVMQTKVGHSEAQLTLMTDRARRVDYLGDQGLTPRSDGERVQEQILLVKGEMSSDEAAIVDLHNQIARMRQQQRLAEISLEHELKTQRQRNLEKLDELQSAIIDLSDRIDKSVVHAPITGIVESIPIEAEHMFAARGATLMTLTQPIETAQVSFSIPVAHIDQIRPGMIARVTIPSIPQRLMPKMEVTIDSISPRARYDEAERPIAFTGLATADADVFDELRETIHLDTLTEDMPVTMMVSVRQTTFADYLFTPFASAFSRALQD